MNQGHTNSARHVGRAAQLAGLARSAFVGAVALAGLSSSSASAQTAYCATLGGQLFELDLASGIATPLFPTGINQLFGIAETGVPNQLLISGVTARMRHVDLTTGAVTNTSVMGTPMFAICNHEDNGKVYGVSLGSLYEVDPATGGTTLIGPTGSLSVWGLDYHRGLQTLVGFSSITNELISIDAATGVGTVIGPTTTGIVGLWYDEVGNKLFGICDQNNAGCIREIDVNTGAATLLHSTGMNLVSIGGRPGGGSGPMSIGSNYCTAIANTTGSAAAIAATGSEVALDNDVTLECTGVPANQFGFFLTSMTQGNTANPGGSQGILCLGGTTGRYVAPGQIMNAGAGGTFALALDLTQTPAGPVFVSIQAGETWNFQGWYRDTGPAGQPWSNFTDGVTVTFQ